MSGPRFQILAAASASVVKFCSYTPQIRNRSRKSGYGPDDKIMCPSNQLRIFIFGNDFCIKFNKQIYFFKIWLSAKIKFRPQKNGVAEVFL